MHTTKQEGDKMRQLAICYSHFTPWSTLFVSNTCWQFLTEIKACHLIDSRSSQIRNDTSQFQEKYITVQCFAPSKPDRWLETCRWRTWRRVRRHHGPRKRRRVYKYAISGVEGYEYGNHRAVEMPPMDSTKAGAGIATLHVIKGVTWRYYGGQRCEWLCCIRDWLWVC